MSAPDAVELRRAVWRQEHGYLSAERVRIEWLDEEYRRALEAHETLAGHGPAIRAHAPALLLEYDGARRRAERALHAGHDLRAALEHLLRCRALLARMRALLDADAALRRAAEAMDGLHRRAAPRLRALPCVDVPARLLEAARERMREGLYARAAYLARACHREAAPLLADAPPDPARAGALEAAFRDLRELCAVTRGVLPDAAEDPCVDGTLDAAEALLRDGAAALAERVAEELAALLAPRGRFRRTLEQAGENADAAMTEVRRRLAEAPPHEERWTAATRALWQVRAAHGLRRIHGEQARLDRLRDGSADDGDGSGCDLPADDFISNPGDA
ncbi:MAG TPA: hypothetical protein VF142_10015 [Longimicrobium sp.]